MQGDYGIRAHIMPPPPDAYGRVLPLSDESLAINASLDWDIWRSKHDILDTLEKTTVADPSEDEVGLRFDRVWGVL
jgi:hypothetical protein